MKGVEQVEEKVSNMIYKDLIKNRNLVDPNETIFTRINKCDFSHFEKSIRTTMKNFKDKIENSFRIYCTRHDEKLFSNLEYSFLWFIKHSIYKRFLYIHKDIQREYINDFNSFMESGERIFKNNYNIVNSWTIYSFYEICQNLYKLGTDEKDFTDGNDPSVYKKYNKWQEELFDILIYLYIDDVKDIMSEELYKYLTIIIRHNGKYNEMDKGGFFYEL